jgi:hypothetical protein
MNADLPPNPPQPAPPFQFRLRTLLLLFVVLGSSMAVFREAAIVVFPIVLGLALVNRARHRSAIRLVAGGMGWAIAVFFVWCIVPQIGAPREAGRRSACYNRLSYLARALKDYHKMHGSFPPAYLADKNGKPLHSWRTLLLPYLGYEDVYKGLDLAQPWDSPKNAQLLAIHPREFFCFCDPSSRAPGSRQANYLAVVGPDSAWAGDKSKKLSDFGANASTTIMIIEVAESGIDWAKPEDFSIDALSAAPAPSVFSRHCRQEGFFFIDDGRSGVCVLTADGHGWYLPTEALSPEKLQKLLRIGGFKLEEIDSLADVHYDMTSRPNWPNIAALAVWLLSVGMLLTLAVRSRRLAS